MDQNRCTSIVPSNSSLLVRCKLNGQGFMYCLNVCTTYSELCEEVFRRFSFRSNDVVKLHYSLPNCAECFLDSEDDFKMLFTGELIYKVQCVEISVSKYNGSISSSCIGSVDDSCSALEEDGEFLGDAFRSEAPKRFLSDEWSTYIKCIGQKFDNIDDFRCKLKKYAIGVGFKFIYKRNQSVRVHAICGHISVDDRDGNCTWFVNGSVAPSSGYFYIRHMNNVHSCRGVLRAQKHRRLDSDLVMTCIGSDVMYNASLRPKEVISKFKSTYGFDISYKVAMKANEKAKERLYGSEADSFNKLSWYKGAVMKTNPDSYFELEVDEHTSCFKRLFLAYGGCVRGFQFFLPVLYVDGTFGKSLYKGQILGATGRNGNRGIFPLAMCVCDSESEDNWYFFFSHLKKLLEPQERVITFISDRGVGLLKAFDALFPGNPHLYCYKHLSFNLAKRFTGKGNSFLLDKVRDRFFKVAYSSTEKEYSYNLKQLREVGGKDIIDPFLSTIPVQHWCRAFYQGCRYGIMANAVAESFNNWIKTERTMSVYCFVEQTRVKLMEMNGNRSLEAEGWTGILTPEMESKLVIEMDRSRTLSVYYSCPGVYEVKSDYTYTVNLNDRTCSCVKWQINCFPCPHALAAIQVSPRGNIYDYIDKYFHADTFKKCYSFPIYPISNVDEKYTESTTGYIFPPITKRPPGRRRKSRIMSSGEYVKKSITCSRCHKKGNHNKLTCTEVIGYN